MTIQEFRAKRIAEEISAAMVAKKANIDRTRLSLVENGHIELREGDMDRLEAALAVLIGAKAAIRKAAIAAGWPATRMSSRRHASLLMA